MTYESLGSLSGGSGGIGDLGGLDCFRDLGGSPPAPSFSAPRPAPRPKMNNLMNECSDAPGPRRSQPLPPKTVEDIHRRELLQVIEALRSAIRGNDETLVRLTLTDLVNALRRAIHLASSWKLSVNILDTLESFLTQAKNLELGFTSAKVSQVDALMKALDLFGGIKPPPLEGKPREEFWK